MGLGCYLSEVKRVCMDVTLPAEAVRGKIYLIRREKVLLDEERGKIGAIP
jgi:hypothetical protein